MSELQYLSFQGWIGFGEFFQNLEYNAIWLYMYNDTSYIYLVGTALESLRALPWYDLVGTVVQCCSAVTWLHVKNSSVKLLRFIKHVRDFISWKKTVPTCLIILGFCRWLKPEKFIWDVHKNNRIIVLLCKGSDQASGNSDLRDIERKLMKRVTQDLQKEGIQLDEKPWDRDLDDGKQPVIVFCVISSRIGTDIENAMRGVHGKSQVILVLLHCVLSGLLRGDLSDDEELLDPTMINRMAGIAHFAFSDREGLYPCQQNTDGFVKLRDIFGSFGDVGSREDCSGNARK